jgi:hypothetical protein
MGKATTVAKTYKDMNDHSILAERLHSSRGAVSIR